MRRPADRRGKTASLGCATPTRTESVSTLRRVYACSPRRSTGHAPVTAMISALRRSMSRCPTNSSRPHGRDCSADYGTDDALLDGEQETPSPKAVQVTVVPACSPVAG